MNSLLSAFLWIKFPLVVGQNFGPLWRSEIWDGVKFLEDMLRTLVNDRLVVGALDEYDSFLARHCLRWKVQSACYHHYLLIGCRLMSQLDGGAACAVVLKG